MTIKTPGTVTITEDKVLAEHFHCVGADEFGAWSFCGFLGARVEMLTWAQGRLAEAIAEQKEALLGRQNGVKG